MLALPAPAKVATIDLKPEIHGKPARAFSISYVGVRRKVENAPQRCHRVRAYFDG